MELSRAKTLAEAYRLLDPERPMLEDRAVALKDAGANKRGPDGD